MLTSTNLRISSIKKGNHSENWEEWILAVSLFIFSTPVFLWHLEYVYYIFSYIFILFSIKPIFRSSENKSIFGYVLIFIYSYIASRYILLNKGGFLGFLFLSISFASIILIDSRIWVNVFKKYVWIFSITLIPSILQFLLVYIFNFSFSSTVIAPSPWNPHPGSFYYKYFFFVQENFGQYYLVPRFCGLYDEPGFIGTIAMVILFTNRYTLNSKQWYNIPILLGGLLSFSFFFYLSTIFYLLLNINIKSTKYYVLITFILLFSIISSVLLDSYVYQRLITIFQSMQLMGSRESDNFSFFYNSLYISDLLFGVPLNTTLVFSTTYKYIIVVIGAIPLIIFSIVLFLFAKSKLYTSKNLLLFISIPIFVFAQRPFLNNIFYLFLTIVPLYYFYNNRIQDEIKFK